jgi:hypothetical protein
MTTTKKFIIGILLLLAGLATGAASAQGIGYTPPPYVLYDSTGNPFPTGSGTALNFMPPAFTCYTIVASAVVPCSFSGGGASTFSGLSGVATAAQLPAATTSAQGAVQLPTGAGSNVLGTAALQAVSAFDAAGAAGGTPLNIVPVEKFGAVADYPGPGGGTGVGTDNTAAIQRCINYLQTTVGSGQCLLKQGNYRITAPIVITHANVGIAGSSYGAGSIASQGNQIAANAPISALYIDSATADAIDVNPSGTSVLSYNQFNDFTIMRTQAASALGSGCGTGVGPAGLSLRYVGGSVIDRVWSEDSACDFYLLNSGGYGTGYVSNSGAEWGLNGFSPAITSYGFYVDGSASPESTRIRDSWAGKNALGGSVTTYGLYDKGAIIQDLMVRGFETTFLSYGEYFNYTGSGTNVNASDVHVIDAINDTDTIAGIYVAGLTAVSGGNLEIKGGWDSSQQSGAVGIDIENSSGVSASNVLIVGAGQYGTGGVGIKAVNSSRLIINNNNLLNTTPNAIQLSNVSDSTITGNVLSAVSGFPTATFLSATGSTYNSLVGNTVGGYGTTGISLDATSSNNTLQNTIDPAHITTPLSNLGSNNLFAGSGGSTTWPPSGAVPVFSPVAGAITSGSTVTATCTGGSPYISTGTTAVAGATGIVVSSAETLYGSCQGSGYFTTASAAYTTGTVTTVGYAPTLSASQPSQYVIGNDQQIGVSGRLTSVTVQYYVAPTAGPLTIGVFSGTYPTLTPVSSFTVNVAATTAPQTFTAPTNFTAPTVTSSEYLAYWAPSSSGAYGPGSGTQAGVTYFYVPAPTYPTGAITVTGVANYAVALQAVITNP